MTIYLGIDAGNSKTAVLACLASGKVAGAAPAGCGDIARPDVASAAFRLARIDWPEDRAYWDEVLSRQ
jgi:N-acetylglucosamine kinase-like BadF-type ATPase